VNYPFNAGAKALTTSDSLSTAFLRNSVLHL